MGAAKNAAARQVPGNDVGKVRGVGSGDGEEDCDSGASEIEQARRRRPRGGHALDTASPARVPPGLYTASGEQTARG